MFNQLTPEETEALAILSEECGEVIQAIGKILRHLEREIGHVRHAVTLLADQRVVRMGQVLLHEGEKMQSIKPYLHHLK